MAVKGSATVTLSQYRDTESVTRYYKLQSSSLAAPDKPSNVKPNETPAGWSKSEPACDITKTLYTCDVTVFSDKTTHVSDVSKSTSYEAAKEAWNKANKAQGTANEAKKYTDNALNNYGYQYTAEIEVAGDPNTYYPVMIYGPREQDVMREILVKRSFSDKAPQEWNGHPTTYGIGCTCKIKCNFGEWGGAEYDWRIHELNEMYGHVFGGCKIDNSGMMFFIFLRGGGAKYYLYSDMRMDDVFPSDLNPTTTDGPSIWYNGDLVSWRGGTAENPEYSFYAPEPRTYTDVVIKEIHDRTYIQVATDAYKNADTAQNTANKAQSSANTAQNTADKAQNTADKAQSSADKAQNTATEAAKTADNYISTDSTGIMVSENKGATKETPSNATKNNVLITEKDVQIRNGKKVVASYGETINIGGETEQHVTIAKDKMAVNAGTESLFSVDSFKSGTEIISTWINTDKLTPTEDIYPEISDSIAFSVEDINDTIDLDGRYFNSFTYSFFNKGAKRVWFELENGDTITIDKSINSNSLHYEEFSDGNGYCNSFDLITREKISRTDIIALRASYDIDFNPAIVDIGQYRTKDVINYQGMNLYDFKALKIGSGIASENNRRDAFTVDFLGNGYFGNTLNVEQDIRAMYIGAAQADVNKISAENISAENISADNITMNMQRGTGKITLTTGAVEYQPRWWRCGNIVQMEVGTKCTGKVASGANIAAGKITRVPKPITKSGVRAVSYYGNNANISYMGSDGTFYARNAGADALGNGNDCIGGFTYITDGTML